MLSQRIGHTFAEFKSILSIEKTMITRHFFLNGGCYLLYNNFNFNSVVQDVTKRDQIKLGFYINCSWK